MAGRFKTPTSFAPKGSYLPKAANGLSRVEIVPAPACAAKLRDRLRLFDPPLHEFLPGLEELIVEIATLRGKGVSKKEIKEKESSVAGWSLSAMLQREALLVKPPNPTENAEIRAQRLADSSEIHNVCS
jgi:hypothetical protein